MKKQKISILLVFCMLLAFLPDTVLAAQEASISIETNELEVAGFTDAFPASASEHQFEDIEIDVFHQILYYEEQIYQDFYIQSVFENIIDTSFVAASMPVWITHPVAGSTTNLNRDLTVTWGSNIPGESFRVTLVKLESSYTPRTYIRGPQFDVGTARQITIPLSELGGGQFVIWVGAVGRYAQDRVEFELRVPPTVNTRQINPQTGLGSSVTLQGETLLNGGDAVTRVGMDLSFSSNMSNPWTVSRATTANERIRGVFSINATNLTAGRTIYYRAWAENRAGRSMGQIRSFTTATTSITASPNTLNFASHQVGYTRQPVQNVTITNTGNTNVTLNTLPTVDFWVLTPSANWTTAMAPGQSRTFSIRPQDGLLVGIYSPTITITGSGGANVQVRPTFTVTSAINSISVSPATHNFGNQQIGYTRRPVQNFTVTNTGNTNITLNILPTVDFWVLTPSANWTTAMAPGQSRTFSIRPQDGLRAGTYSPTITITGRGSANVQVQVQVQVRPTFTVYTRPNVRLLGTTRAVFDLAIAEGVGTPPNRPNETNRIRLELIDLETMKSFDISWAVSTGYHTDWDPWSLNDTNIARTIPGWNTWNARPGILRFPGGHLVAVGFHLRPHDISFRPNNGINGHMCMFYGTGGGGCISTMNAGNAAARVALTHPNIALLGRTTMPLAIVRVGEEDTFDFDINEILTEAQERQTFTISFDQTLIDINNVRVIGNVEDISVIMGDDSVLIEFTSFTDNTEEGIEALGIDSVLAETTPLASNILVEMSFVATQNALLYSRIPIVLFNNHDESLSIEGIITVLGDPYCFFCSDFGCEVCVPPCFYCNDTGCSECELPFYCGYCNGEDIEDSNVTITLNPSVNYVFPNVMSDYTITPSHQVQVTNTSMVDTGSISIHMSGENPASFTVTPNVISNIPVGQSVSFTVSPVLGLNAGEHSATVTVAVDSLFGFTPAIATTTPSAISIVVPNELASVMQSFDVSFTVNTGGINFGDLNAVIFAAENRTQTNYTALSWAQMQSALNAARITSNNPTANQALIDSARDNLIATLNELVPISVFLEPNWTALDAAIAEAESRIQSNYTPLSWARLQSPLNAARTTRNNATANQTLIDSATTNLITAIYALVVR